MPIIVQQDATIYSLFISVNRCTCFGWYLHPSSGAHVPVSTASGIRKPVTAICRERDWTSSRPVTLQSVCRWMLWIQEHELLMMGGDTTRNMYIGLQI